MIEVQIDKLLKKHDRTFYWLAKETGISHTTLWRLKKRKALGINFDTLRRYVRRLIVNQARSFRALIGSFQSAGPTKKL
jgi:DNA-binding Xre family transcriptional regulator